MDVMNYKDLILEALDNLKYPIMDRLAKELAGTVANQNPFNVRCQMVKQVAAKLQLIDDVIAEVQGPPITFVESGTT